MRAGLETPDRRGRTGLDQQGRGLTGNPTVRILDVGGAAAIMRAATRALDRKRVLTALLVQSSGRTPADSG